MPAKIVSLINLKGGVAKTTTTVQLAECLASEFSKRVLVIDLDPQTNATVALIGEDKWDILDKEKQTIFNLFDDILKDTHHFNIERAIQKKVSNLSLASLDLLPSSIKLIDIENQLNDIPHKTEGSLAIAEVLKKSITSKIENYDYILIDCPPNLGNITKNGIEISNYYLIPTIADRLSIYGLPQIIRSVHNFAQKRPNCKIKCLGLIITKYQSNSNIHYQVMKYDLPTRFKQSFEQNKLAKSPIFNTIMPQANKTSDAMNFEQQPKTFKEKYGYQKVGDKFLYQYIIDLTKEFIYYAQ